MTIHKSKGLEFPVVFLPFGLFKTQAKSEGVYIDPETHLRRYVFAADATAIEKDYFADDALAEDIRLPVFVNSILVTKAFGTSLGN